MSSRSYLPWYPAASNGLEQHRLNLVEISGEGSQQPLLLEICGCRGPLFLLIYKGLT